MEYDAAKPARARTDAGRRLGWKGPGRYLFRAGRCAPVRRDCADEGAYLGALAAAEAAAGGRRAEAVKVRGHGPSVADRLPAAASAWSSRNAFGPDEVGAWCDEPIWLVCAECGREWRTTPRAMIRRAAAECTCTRCRKAEHAADACRKTAVVCIDNGMRFASVSAAARWLASVLPGGLSAGYLRLLLYKGLRSGELVKGYRFAPADDDDHDDEARAERAGERSEP